MMNNASSPANPVFDESSRRSRLVLQTMLILLSPIVVALLSGVIIRATVGPAFANTYFRQVGPLVSIVAIVVFTSAIILLVRLKKTTVSSLVLISVWTLLTTLGSLFGGASSMFPALLLIPICAAGLLLDGVAAISLAGLASVLVGGIAWIDAHHLVERPPVLQAASPTEHPTFLIIAVVFWMIMFFTIAALTSLLAGNLQRTLLQSRTQADVLQTLSDDLEVRVAQQTAQLLEQEREAAVLEERTRLARDIHDTLAQGLTGIVVQLGAAQQILLSETHAADQQIDLAQRMARESLAEARRSVWNLRSPMLERGDLADALRSIVEHANQSGPPVRFVERGDAWPLSPAVDSALLRVAQEALANISKHAQATQAQVTLNYTPTAVMLEISDDGRGFEASKIIQPPGPLGGFGILGMRERLAALEGLLTITTIKGTTITASVPYQEAKR